jgi:CRP/FNR family transcriptional regulator
MKQSGDKTSEGIIINLELNREDMANFVGVTRETISRKLSKLSDEVILKIIESKQILVIDETYFETY